MKDETETKTRRNDNDKECGRVAYRKKTDRFVIRNGEGWKPHAQRQRYM